MHKLWKTILVLELVALVALGIAFVVLVVSNDSPHEPIPTEELMSVPGVPINWIEEGVVTSIDGGTVTITVSEGDIVVRCYTESAIYMLEKVSVGDVVEASYFDGDGDELPSLSHIYPIG